MRAAAAAAVLAVREGVAGPAGGARAADRQVTPTPTVTCSTACCSSHSPVLRDRQRASVDHQHHRAASHDLGSSRASRHAGYQGAKSEHAPPPHQSSSAVLRVRAASATRSSLSRAGVASVVEDARPTQKSSWSRLQRIRPLKPHQLEPGWCAATSLIRIVARRSRPLFNLRKVAS